MKIFAFRTRLILFSIIQNFLCYAVVNLRLPPTKVGSCIKEVASFGDSLYIIALRKNYVKCFFIFFKIFEIFLKHSTKNTMNA